MIGRHVERTRVVGPARWCSSCPGAATPGCGSTRSVARRGLYLLSRDEARACEALAEQAPVGRARQAGLRVRKHLAGRRLSGAAPRRGGASRPGRGGPGRAGAARLGRAGVDALRGGRGARDAGRGTARVAAAARRPVAGMAGAGCRASARRARGGRRGGTHAPGRAAVGLSAARARAGAAIWPRRRSGWRSCASAWRGRRRTCSRRRRSSRSPTRSSPSATRLRWRRSPWRCRGGKRCRRRAFTWPRPATCSLAAAATRSRGDRARPWPRARREVRRLASSRLTCGDRAGLAAPDALRRQAEALLASPTRRRRSDARGAAGPLRCRRACRRGAGHAPERARQRRPPVREGAAHRARPAPRSRRACEATRAGLRSALAAESRLLGAQQLAELEGRPAGARDEARDDARATAARGPRAYLTSRGLSVLVGRGARENHRLTFAVARPEDLWLHARDVPGRARDPARPRGAGGRRRPARGGGAGGVLQRRARPGAGRRPRHATQARAGRRAADRDACSWAIPRRCAWRPATRKAGCAGAEAGRGADARMHRGAWAESGRRRPGALAAAGSADARCWPPASAAGYSPIAPGTAGSLLGLRSSGPLHAPARRASSSRRWRALFVAGRLRPPRTSRGGWAQRTPGIVVVDEVVGHVGVAAVPALHAAHRRSSASCSSGSWTWSSPSRARARGAPGRLGDHGRRPDGRGLREPARCVSSSSRGLAPAAMQRRDPGRRQRAADARCAPTPTPLYLTGAAARGRAWRWARGSPWPTTRRCSSPRSAPRSRAPTS